MSNLSVMKAARRLNKVYVINFHIIMLIFQVKNLIWTYFVLLVDFNRNKNTVIDLVDS